MPFRECGSAAQVKLVILPATDDGRHDLHRHRISRDALRQPPGFRWILAQFFVAPIAIHNVEMDFSGPVAIEELVGRCLMAATMQRILVGTRANLKSKIKESLRIVLLVARVIGTRQGTECAWQAMWPAVDPDLVVIARIRFEVLQQCHTRIVVSNSRRCRFAGVVQPGRLQSILHEEVPRIGCAAPH